MRTCTTHHACDCREKLFRETVAALKWAVGWIQETSDDAVATGSKLKNAASVLAEAEEAVG